MIDRYTRIVLTVIAVALIYLCIVMTPFPSVQAQGTQRPGEASGPQEVVVVGWRPTTPLPIVSPEPLRVVTEQRQGITDRIVVAGWEEMEKGRISARRFDAQNIGLPVSVKSK